MPTRQAKVYIDHFDRCSTYHPLYTLHPIRINVGKQAVREASYQKECLEAIVVLQFIQQFLGCLIPLAIVLVDQEFIFLSGGRPERVCVCVGCNAT